MKTIEFDLDNCDKWNIKTALQSIYEPEKKVIECGKVRVIIRPIMDTDGLFTVNTSQEMIDLLDEDTREKVIQKLKGNFEERKANTIKLFEELKAKADTILFDDKDYLDLIKEFDNIYACQSVTMLKDILEAKTKGKTAKSLKYQARQLALSNTPSCD